MMIKRISKLFVAFGVLLASFVGISNTFADMDGMDTVMTISPPKQWIVLTPGEDFEGSITVSSSSTAKNGLKYSVTVGAFSLVTDENGNVDYNDVDVDTVTKKNSHEEILNKFKNENIDILIGTQMVVKGHHFPNVTLVGVIAADSSLNIDDYRANERTFQILTQVARTSW